MEDRQEENAELEENTDSSNISVEPGKNLPDIQTVEDAVNVNEMNSAAQTEDVREIDAASDAPKYKSVRTASSGSSSTIPKLVMLFGLLVAVGVGLVFWKNTVAAHHQEATTKITKEEMELLLKDFNPMQLKQLSQSPDQKKELVNNITELLAIAEQARREGLDNEPNIRTELDGFDKSIYAINYDKEINADKGPMPPFGYISEDQVKKFWGENKNQSGLSWIWNGAEKRRREAEFDQFIETKIELARERGQIAKDQEPTADELKGAKDAFAKTQIYYAEAMNKLDGLKSLPPAEQKKWREWQEKTELQIKLQKAQFLTQNYVQTKLAKKFEVSDTEVEKYIAANPNLTNDGDKKKKAEDILAKVKNGGDFAELAKEYSDDPGSKEKGGLYEDIAQGQFAPEFEAAAFALKEGDVANQVVKTDFGYHIIKLEKKGEAKGANGQTTPTFSARHILISTMVKDPDDPTAREMPATQFAKAKLEKEKQKAVLDEIKKNNPVEVATNFEIPKVSDEELQKMQQQQMQQMQQQQGPPPPPQAPQAPPAEQ